MSIDITKPLVRRDGLTVDWVHEITEGIVYGFTEYILDCDYSITRYVLVNRRGRYLEDEEHPADLIQAPEYEYAAVWASDTNYTNIYVSGNRYWADTEVDRDRDSATLLGHLRRKKGDNSTIDWVPKEATDAK